MRVTVLGFDGATLDRIAPLVGSGELPGFARLMREGAWGPLRSTVPPDSPSAWTSFATGVNPGRHGVFGFMARRLGTHRFDIGSSTVVRAPTLWHRAGEQGARVGVINVPITYPPRPVNGFLVAGMMTPDLGSRFTHPPELRDALLNEIPDYSTSHGLGRTQGGDPRDVLARDYAATIAMRERAMNWLAKRYSPDLLICVFTVLDRLQHFLWAAGDPSHPDHDAGDPAAMREAIPAAYRLLDGVVERVQAAAGADDLLAVVSDHGFEGVAQTFSVNAWLAAEGYLALTGEDPEPGRQARRFARTARRWLRKVPGTGHLRERLRVRRLLSDAFVRAIEWPRTRAWLGLDRGLWINVAGRDPEGSVAAGEAYERLRAELIDRLEALRDPDGRPVVHKVHRREEVHAGPELQRAPDLIVEPARDPGDPAGRFILSERIETAEPHRFIAPSSPITGNHTPEGVVFLWGRGVRAGKELKDARIIDIAPTILAAMDLAGGQDMDGKPLGAAMKFGAARRAESKQPGHAEKISGRGPQRPAEAPFEMSDDERAAVEQRLKDLGYMD